MKKTLFLLLIFCFVVLGTFAQSLQNYIFQFRSSYEELSRLDEACPADSFINKGKRLEHLYLKIINIDSTKTEPYLLFVPFRVVAEGYDKKKDYDNAIQYYTKAGNIAVEYIEQLVKMGLNTDGYISTFTNLRDDYLITKQYRPALQISKDIVAFFKQTRPNKSAYQQYLLSEIWTKIDNTDSLLYSAKQCVQLLKDYGNDESEFYVTSPILQVLNNLVRKGLFQQAVNFMDSQRETVTSLIVGNDSLECAQLAGINSNLYKAYMELNFSDRAVNAAKHSR